MPDLLHTRPRPTHEPHGGATYMTAATLDLSSDADETTDHLDIRHPAIADSDDRRPGVPGDAPALPCRTAAPDLWFAESPADVERAKALCMPCPLRQPCLAGALDRREPWGVWGGQLVLQGGVVPRKRPRGRPRKADSLAWSAA